MYKLLFIICALLASTAVFADGDHWVSNPDGTWSAPANPHEPVTVYPVPNQPGNYTDDEGHGYHQTPGAPTGWVTDNDGEHYYPGSQPYNPDRPIDPDHMPHPDNQ